LKIEFIVAKVRRQAHFFLKIEFIVAKVRRQAQKNEI
jgi:hypothetical protein